VPKCCHAGSWALSASDMFSRVKVALCFLMVLIILTVSLPSFLARFPLVGLSTSGGRCSLRHFCGGSLGQFC